MDQRVKAEYKVESEKCGSLRTTLGTAVHHSVFGWLFAAAGLLWVLHDLHLTQLAQQLRRVNWRWIVAGLLCDVLSYICQGWRWKLLLKPAAELSMLKSAQAVYIGLFINEALPLRAGELARAYLVAQWTGAGMIAIIPSMIVERLFDGVWIAVGIGLTACFIPLPEALHRAGEMLGLAVMLTTSLFWGLALREPRTVVTPSPLTGRRLRRFFTLLFERISSGLCGIGRTRAFYLSFILSLAFLVLQMLAFWLVMIGYGLRASLPVGVMVFLIVHLSTAIPGAPGNVGSYQFFTVVGLTLFGLDKTLATGFSLFVFVLLTLPLLLIGFLALNQSRISLHSIRLNLMANRKRRAPALPQSPRAAGYQSES